MKGHRALLPLVVFLVVLGAHFVWLGLFPEVDPAQSRWTEVPVSNYSWLKGYLDRGDYWLGYSYGVSLSFAAAGLLRYRERRLAASRNLAVGSVSFTGALALVGCYLLGCCGSPMLAVYMSLFGAAFLPWVKPLVALLTTVTLFAAWRFSVRCSNDPIKQNVAEKAPNQAL